MKLFNTSLSSKRINDLQNIAAAVLTIAFHSYVVRPEYFDKPPLNWREFITHIVGVLLFLDVRDRYRAHQKER